MPYGRAPARAATRRCRSGSRTSPGLRHWRVRRRRRARGSRCPARAARRSSAGSVRASKPNCVTSDTASPRCCASATLACNAAIQRSRVDRRMAFRVAAECDIADAVALDQAGRQQVEAGAERPDRTVVAADQQDAIDRRLGRRALQEIAGLGEAGEPPRRDMRHRDETGAAQPRAGGDDVVVRHAGRMIDEHRGAGIEQPAQRLAGEFVARRSSIEQLPISAATR